MGLFQHKQSKKMTAEEAAIAEQLFFDENFREELRNHGRLYFEKVLTENGALFKQDLDATVMQITIDLKEHLIKQLDVTIQEVNAELKEHVTKQLDEQFLNYGKAIKDAQDIALESLNRSAESLQAQNQELSDTIKKNIVAQEETLSKASQENLSRLAAMKDAQDTAVKSLESSAQTMQEQYQQLSGSMQKNLADQESALVNVFEQNTAQIIEHYLLGALGDQYDLKAQLPSIIQQMEANKQAIVDDMKL